MLFNARARIRISMLRLILEYEETKVWVGRLLNDQVDFIWVSSHQRPVRLRIDLLESVLALSLSVCSLSLAAELSIL